ncbi:MAG: hypothetical protein U0794_15395 [Isosphaeraceae bacterium]
MPFHYTTEYTLGRRGRVHRSFTGIQALIAIAFDIVLGLTFGTLHYTFWILFQTLFRIFQVVFLGLTIPFRIARAVSDVVLGPPPAPSYAQGQTQGQGHARGHARPYAHAHAYAKPAMPAYDEL